MTWPGQRKDDPSNPEITGLRIMILLALIFGFAAGILVGRDYHPALNDPQKDRAQQETQNQ